MSNDKTIERRQVRTCVHGHSWVIKRISVSRYGIAHSHTEGELMCPECHGIAVASVNYPPEQDSK